GERRAHRGGGTAHRVAGEEFRATARLRPPGAGGAGHSWTGQARGGSGERQIGRRAYPPARGGRQHPDGCPGEQVRADGARTGRDDLPLSYDCRGAQASRADLRQGCCQAVLLRGVESVMAGRRRRYGDDDRRYHWLGDSGAFRPEASGGELYYGAYRLSFLRRGGWLLRLLGRRPLIRPWALGVSSPTTWPP